MLESDSQAPAPAPRAAPRVSGYRIRRRLGGGSAAAMFEAEQAGSGRTVALKVLPLRRDTAGWIEEAFRREAALQARCRAGQVVAVIEAGAGEDCLFIALEHVPGEDLDARLARCGRLGPVEALALARDVALALCDVAAAGVLHGDVKPTNLLLGGGRTWLADFGAARPLDRPYERGRPSWLGTPPFVAPEQVLARSPRPEHAGQTIDARADLYGLGITLYLATTGALPTDATDPRDFIGWILRGEVPDPRQAAPELPADLARLIVDLTRKHPADRPASAIEVHRRVAAMLLARTAAPSGRPG